MKEKVVDGFYKVKSYWRKPPKGYDVNYKEFLAYGAGTGNNSFLSVLLYWTTLGMNMPLMTAYFGLTPGSAWILGIVGSILALVRSPFLSMILDNTKSHKGKFKAHMMWSIIAASICFMIIPYIPKSANEISVITFNFPVIPYISTQPEVINISLGLLLAFVFIQIGTIFQQIFFQCWTGLGQVISNNSQERANMESFKSLLSNLPGSIINVIVPLLSGVFAIGVINTPGYKEGTTDPNLYKVLFPICAIGAIGLTVLLMRYCKERVVTNKAHVNKVRFIDGVKILCCSSGFWIIVLFTVFQGIRVNASGSLPIWVSRFSIGGDLGNTVWAICNVVLNNAFMVGSILGPFIVKKLGKKNTLIFSSIGFAVLCGVQYLFAFSPFMLLACIFFLNMFQGFVHFGNMMAADTLDELQYKTGLRLEGFWQNFSMVITTIFGFGVSFLNPMFLSMGGLSFGQVPDNVLPYDEVIRQSVYEHLILLSLIGAVLTVIPLFFYRLSERKHAKIVEALCVRASVKNYEENNLSVKDVITMNSILVNNKEAVEQYVNGELPKFVMKGKRKVENYDMIIVDEILKYQDILEEINTYFDRCHIIQEKRDRVDYLEELGRNIDLEEKLLNIKVARAKAKLKSEENKFYKDIEKIKKKDSSFDEKTYIEENQARFVFNEEEFKAKAIENSRFMKDKALLEELKTIEIESEDFLKRDMNTNASEVV